MGQTPDLSFLDESLASSTGSLHFDLETMQTSLPGVFAGGDCVRGPRTIVEAVADGKRAAESIHRHLGFEIDSKRMRSNPSLFPLSPENLFEGVWLSQRPPAMPKTDIVTRRKGLRVDVEPTLDRVTAVAEAFRCLYCGLQPRISLPDCSLCGACLGICPQQCIEMVGSVSERMAGRHGPGPRKKQLDSRLTTSAARAVASAQGCARRRQSRFRR